MAERVAIVCPDVGTSEPLRFGLWHVRVGDDVREGERVAEVHVDGATIDVLAPTSGRLRRRRARADEATFPGQLLGEIEPDGVP